MRALVVWFGSRSLCSFSSLTLRTVYSIFRWFLWFNESLKCLTTEEIAMFWSLIFGFYVINIVTPFGEAIEERGKACTSCPFRSSKPTPKLFRVNKRKSCLWMATIVEFWVFSFDFNAFLIQWFIHWSQCLVSHRTSFAMTARLHAIPTDDQLRPILVITSVRRKPEAVRALKWFFISLILHFITH